MSRKTLMAGLPKNWLLAAWVASWGLVGLLAFLILDGLRHPNTLQLQVLQPATNAAGSPGYMLFVGNPSRSAITFRAGWEGRTPGGRWILELEGEENFVRTLPARTQTDSLFLPEPKMTNRPIRVCLLQPTPTPSSWSEKFVLAGLDKVIRALFGREAFFPDVDAVRTEPLE